jgi:DNA polymerase III subunit beta
MKVVCDRAMLNEAFQIAQSVVNPRSPKPALQCVKMEVANKQVRLLATDLEVGTRVVLTEGMNVESAGEILLPADRVGAILKELSSEQVSITVEDRTATIETSDSKFTIMGDDPADFPTVPDFGKEGATEIESKKLLSMIHKTVFATAREAARYALNGVLWEMRGKEIRMIATDGHRLAVAKGQCKGEKTAGQVSAIVPTKAIHLIERSIADSDKVEIQIGEKELLIRAGHTVVYSRLVDGHFPKYEDVVPKDCDRKVELNTSAFQAAVRRAALLTNEESRGVKFTFSSDKAVLSSRAPEMGEARTSVAATMTGGEGEFEIAFNPYFVIDVLKVIESDTFTLQLKSTNKPGLIREGSHYEHVIMPVNTL